MAAIPQRRRWTTEEFHSMVVTGFLHKNERVELVDGDIIDMAPIGSDHGSKVDWLTETFVPLFRKHAITRVQGAVQLDQYNQWSPDVCLLRRREDFYRHANPTAEDVLLVIEVSDSTLQYDRDVKIPRYARDNIPEAWIVNTSAQEIEVHTDPTPEGYASVSRIRDQPIRPSQLPELLVDMTTIF